MRGKIVSGFRYLHAAALNELSDVELEAVGKIIKSANPTFCWNVIKFQIKNPANLSLLLYEDFPSVAFPALLTSYKYNEENKEFKVTRHSKINPPILHRKELLISKHAPEYKAYEALTVALVELGAFSEMHLYGTRKRWDERLKLLGITVIDHTIVQETQ